MIGFIPQFIDFEASGLGLNSYPIEVAWSYPDGSIESHLIEPNSDWQDWDFNAQRLHQIPRELLLTEGKALDWIAARMNQALGNNIVYSDVVNYDFLWCDTLFSYTDYEDTFRIHDANLLFKALCPDLFENKGVFLCSDSLASSNLAQYQTTARKKLGLSPHRAGNDVSFLIELYKLLRQKQGGACESKANDKKFLKIVF